MQIVFPSCHVRDARRVPIALLPMRVGQGAYTLEVNGIEWRLDGDAMVRLGAAALTILRDLAGDGPAKEGLRFADLAQEVELGVGQGGCTFFFSFRGVTARLTIADGGPLLEAFAMLGEDASALETAGPRGSQRETNVTWGWRSPFGKTFDPWQEFWDGP